MNREVAALSRLEAGSPDLIKQIRTAVDKFHAAEHRDESEECYVAGRPDWNREWPTGICTNSALWMCCELGKDRCRVVGYSHDKNPKAKAGADEGGHDFLLIDGLIVDVWLNDMYRGPLITRIKDTKTVKKWYGDSSKWNEVGVVWENL